MTFPQYTDYHFTEHRTVDHDAAPRQTMSPSSATPVPVHTDDRSGTRIAAAGAYMSALPLSVFGPALFWLTARPGSMVRREAAKAFRLTLVMGTLTLVAVLLLDGSVLAEKVFAVGFGLWVLLSVAGAVQAGRGEDWESPVDALIDRIGHARSGHQRFGSHWSGPGTTR